MITVHDRLLLLTLFSKKLHQGRRSRTRFPGNFSAFNSLSVGIVLYSSLSSHFLIFYSLSINYKKSTHSQESTVHSYYMMKEQLKQGGDAFGQLLSLPIATMGSQMYYCDRTCHIADSNLPTDSINVVSNVIGCITAWLFMHVVCFLLYGMDLMIWCVG